MLIDQARIHVRAGDGGDGCTSFYRDRTVQRGKPNGGNGGDGGDVAFKVDKNVHTLLDFQYKRHFKAKRGSHGGSNNKRGKDGESFCIKVPPGTVIRDAKTGFILRDLTYDGEEVIIARRGRGGRGNTKRGEGMPGAKGEEKELLLELKLIADVGIIGYPNVGKSTLISRISRAKSKVADYAFTTKAPVLGVARCMDVDITFADMPGLIEGAHRGRGLGDEFLRHIERTKILLHVVDVAGFGGRDAYEDYISINNELRLYGKHLAEKPQIVAVNKMDVPGSKDKFAAFDKKIGQKTKVYSISARTGEGVKALLARVWEVWKNEI